MQREAQGRGRWRGVALRIWRLYAVECGRRSRRLLLIPLSGFTVWVTTLLVLGVRTGMWAAEYIPTAVIEGLVIAGLLFVACFFPDGAPTSGDGVNADTRAGQTFIELA